MARQRRRVLILESRECPRWCKVEGRTWTEINRGFSRIKSLKRHHLSGYRSPPLATAMGLRPGIRMFLRWTDFSVFIGGKRGRPRRSVSKRRATHVRVGMQHAGAAGKPFDNPPHPRSRRATYRVFPGIPAESLFYDRDVLSRPKADLRLRLCMHTWRQDTVECHRTFWKDISQFDFSYPTVYWVCKKDLT